MSFPMQFLAFSVAVIHSFTPGTFTQWPVSRYTECTGSHFIFIRANAPRIFIWRKNEDVWRSFLRKTAEHDNKKDHKEHGHRVDLKLYLRFTAFFSFILHEKGRNLVETFFKMVLADLGRRITTALRSLSNATIINEEVHVRTVYMFFFSTILIVDYFLDHFRTCSHIDLLILSSETEKKWRE